MRFRVIIEQDEDNMFIAKCPALPGCISQGKSRVEAVTNIKDAVKGYLDSLKKHNEPIPPSIQEEVVELRHKYPPHRRLTIPNHKEIAKGTLLAILREAGLTREALFEGI